MQDDNCIFCKIANGEIPSVTLYEDADFRVIFDLNPATRGHALILPKEHYEDLTVLPEELQSKVLPLAARIGRAMKEGLGAKGFNVVQNNGEAAGQTVHHFHLHIIPRYGNPDEMVLWKPGTSTPEELNKVCAEIGARLK
ncbi:MAG: HIT family protein [Oribacterium sp.]|jgi:histidine triad (HIT) family protein|nr:HIT family protein [Oribacterium sp.]